MRPFGVGYSVRGMAFSWDSLNAIGAKKCQKQGWAKLFEITVAYFGIGAPIAHLFLSMLCYKFLPLIIPNMAPHYLFSVDLEDVRDGVANGGQYRDRVVENTERFLDFLSVRQIKTTFFTVGTVAKRHPLLIKSIVAEGHEIACHTFNHTPLTERNSASFREDMIRNIDALHDAGASDIVGFRAPIYSLTADIPWVYDVLEDLHFVYSSSVLPAKHPLFGWPGFGESWKKIGGILEIPMTLFPFPRVPAGGGIYFRVCPRRLLKAWFRHQKSKQRSITGYFHPFDIDIEQEHFMHAGINNNRVYNWLMYYGRKSVFEKLDEILDLDYIIEPYRSVVSGWESQPF